MEKIFKNKVVLVTGSSRGIGRSIAVSFAKQGADVIINYNSNSEDAEISQAVIESYGVKCLAIKADISSEKEVSEMVNTALKTFKKIDVLVNNAGIVFDVPFEKRQVSHWTKTLNTNLVGTFLVSKYISEHMLENKSGKIINMSSTNGINSTSPESIDYDASKAGIITLTRNLAYQFAPFINVNCVAPGWVDTDMNKDLPNEFVKSETNKVFLKRFARAEEVANVVLFLASEGASYINGETIKVDGGY